MSEHETFHRFVVSMVLVALPLIYLLVPAVIFVPLTAAARHHWVSEAASECISVVLKPQTQLAKWWPAYDRLMEGQVGFCKRHGLLPATRLR